MTGRHFPCLWGVVPVGKQHLFLLLLALPILLATQTQAKFCTSLRSVKKDVNAYDQVLCTQSYQARCSWFSFKMCTFYEKVPCKNQKNETRVTYKIVTECCNGYIRDHDNLTCIRNMTEAVTTDVVMITISDDTTVIPENSGITQAIKKTDDDSTVNISHGAFAAIASIGLFIVCVTVAIVIHVRKKQIREEKAKKDKPTPVELQKMVPA